MSQKSQTNNYTDFYYYFFRNILIISIPLVIIFTLVLSIPHTSAEISSSGTDNVQLILSTSCTIDASVINDHTARLNGGQKEDNIGNTKLSAFCNDNNGYSIYAVGSSNNIDGDTDLISTLGDDYNIHTGVYDSSSIVNPSSWAMKLTAGTGTGIDPTTGASVPRTPPTIVNGYDDYSNIPSVYTQVAKRTAGTSMVTDSNASGSYLNTTYQIYASSYQPAGVYNGKVKYIMVHPNNNTNTIPDIDAAFALAGKQKVYQDSEGSYYSMQDMTSDICNSVLNTGESTTARLVDIRDHNIYYVTKEKDNHCWMTQNLDLDINGPNTSPLTSENTDISTTASGSGIYDTTKGYTENNGVWTWNPQTMTADAVINYTENTATGWTTSYGAPSSAEGGDTYIYTNNVTGNTLDNIFGSLQACIEANPTATDCRHYHVGNYYNWPATIASNSAATIRNAANSICPKGWKLPDGPNEELGQLMVSQGIINSTTVNTYTTNGFINIRKIPLWLVRGGYINGSSLSGVASNGYYQSDSAISDSNAMPLIFNPFNIYTRYNTSGSRSFGLSVRCLAR